MSSDDARFIGGNTGSPLSKRLKLSRDRQGQSGLKVEVFQDHSNATSDAGDDDDDDSEDLSIDADRLEDDNDLERRAQDEEFEEIEAGMRDATDDEEGESDDEDDDDDDFLARDIEFG